MPIQNTMSTPESVSYYTTFAGNLHIATCFFSKLSAIELGRCLSVCKQWNKFANDEALWKALEPKNVFGPRQWTLYYGEIGEAPPFPREIHQNASCPFWLGRKVHETHLLTLIPQTVNGQPLTLKTLGELVQKPLEGHATNYEYLDLDLGKYQDQPAPASHWAILSRDVISRSQDKSYARQQQLVSQYPGYEVPNVLDATVALFMEHVQSGARLYSDEPYTCTRCQEKWGATSQLVVGGFSAYGLYVGNDINGASYGVGGQRKFQPVSQPPSPQPAPAQTPLVFQPSLQFGLPPIAFGAAKWATYFGRVNSQPPLPPDIYQILNAPCPFWPDKKVHETHLLTLIPQTVNGQPLTLKTLEYRYFDLGEYQDQPAPASHWAILSRDVIPGSRNKSYADQQQLVKQYPDYEVPHILDATVALFMEHVQSGTRLYSDEPYTFTQCQEKYNAKWQLVVGGFAAGGLRVHGGYYAYEINGVGGQRKFQPVSQPPSPQPAPAPTPLVFQPSVQFDLPPIAFGAAKWATYFGDVNTQPPLPPDIHQILDTPCPFWFGKKVHETHLLTLIPQTVNGQPLTLKILGDLVQKPLPGPTTKYSYFNLGEYQDQPAPASHWALLSRDVIPGSRNRSYAMQRQLMTRYPGYEVPHILDVTVAIFMEYVQNGTCLYSDEPATLTRCQEEYYANRQLVVGGFAADGLCVNRDYRNDEFYGVGGQRKLS